MIPLRGRRAFECANCGYEGSVPATGTGPLLWVVLVAMAWNAWMFHRVGMELEALVACVATLLGAFAASKTPRWIKCPACGWKHPVGPSDKVGR
jgi:hypothetical protein